MTTTQQGRDGGGVHPAAAPDESNIGARAAATGDGPYDSAQIPELASTDAERVDLGSIQLTPIEGTALRLHVADDKQTVLAAVVSSDDSALELRAFAAARNGERWSQLLPQLVDAAVEAGGQADQSEGPFGTELICQVPGEDAKGNRGLMVSRLIGIDGPRWLLRATLLGRAAVDDEAGAFWEDYLRTVVVHRGNSPMAPGTQLPLTIPAGARPDGD